MTSWLGSHVLKYLLSFSFMDGILNDNMCLVQVMQS